MAATADDHAALMDAVYRGQRHIYDATRKYFLFGRDRLIEQLDCRPGHAVLEIACGTGRNLHKIARRWPGIELHGLDISGEMLKSARVRLGGNARLERADAVTFDPQAVFGRQGFDRVVLSFATSMIPEWVAAVERAADTLLPGGALHIVDFGDLGGIPQPMHTLLKRWLAHFHVTPHSEMVEAASCLAADRGLRCTFRRGPLGYYQLVTITRTVD